MSLFHLVSFLRNWAIPKVFWRLSVAMVAVRRYTSLLSSSTWCEALALVEQMVDEALQMNEITCNAVIKSCRKGKQWRRSLNVLKQMMEKDLPRTVVTYNSLLSSNLEWQQAEKLLKDLQRVLQVSIISYNSILNVYGQSGCWELALLSTMKLERQGMNTELLTQNTVATACERCKQWRTTLAILVSIQKERSKADAFSCSTGIHACGSAKWKKAIDLLQTFGHHKVEANVVCQSAAITACECSGQWQLAMELLAPVPPNLVMCNAALSACAQGAQWQLALELLVSMRHESLQADVISYNSLSLACAVAGHWQTALDVVEAMDSMNLQRNAQSYGILLFCHSSTSHWQDALCLPLQDLFRDIVCCTSAIGACASAEQWQRALHLLQESYHQQLEAGKLNSVEFTTLSQHITVDRNTDETICVYVLFDSDFLSPPAQSVILYFK